MEKISTADVINLMKTVLEDSDIDVYSLDLDEGLDEQGIDSLDLMNIIFQLQDDYEIEISEESIDKGDWLTINKIVRNLNALVT